MSGAPIAGWEMTVFAAIAVALLVMGTFRLDEVLVRRKRAKDGQQLAAGRYFQQPGARLMDPHGRGSAKAPATRRVSARE